MDWLAGHSDVIGVAVNAGLLLIWAVYLHLALRMFRRQSRPNILINRGGGETARSRCLISNMSTDPIYVNAVILEVVAGERRWSRRISDVETLGESESATTAIARTKQGPLANGDFLDIGTYADLVATALERLDGGTGAPAGLAGADGVRITVIAIYTSERELVGATRGFRIARGGAVLQPVESLARQITRRRERRALRAALEGD